MTNEQNDTTVNVKGQKPQALSIIKLDRFSIVANEWTKKDGQKFRTATLNFKSSDGHYTNTPLTLGDVEKIRADLPHFLEILKVS